MSNDRASAPRPSLRQACEQVFRNSPDSADLLIKLLNSQHDGYYPINLTACRTTHSHVLAYAQHFVQTRNKEDTWDDGLGAFAFHRNPGPGSDSACVPVRFVRALLIGTLDSDFRGAIRISSTGCLESVQVVIAPPPSASLRGIPVWIRDWQYVPSRLLARHRKGRGAFEVLLSDVTPLSKPIQNELRLEHLTSDLRLDPWNPINIRGTIHAKSCIIASRSTSACFFIELLGSPANTEGTSTAVIVVFRGEEAMRWWPFLTVGHEIGVTGLTMSLLPSYSQMTVLKASRSNIRIYSVLEQRSETPRAEMNDNGRLGLRNRGQKRPRTEAQMYATKPHQQRQRKYLSQRLVSYEGEITRVLADGRFELDGRVTLHLGGLNGSCAGPAVASLCFRKGARIEACWVRSIVREGRRVSLFPTGRTVVNLLYFGCLEKTECTEDTLEWQDTPWRWLWERWSYLDICWAEELFDNLVVKFKPWFTDSDGSCLSTTNESEAVQLVRYLLGSHDETGLVQFIMYLHSGREDLLETRLSSSLNVYKDFLAPFAPSTEGPHDGYPAVPSFSYLRDRINRLWKDKINRRIAKYEALPCSRSTCRTQYTFLASEIAEGQTNKNRNNSTGDDTNDRSMAVIGLLQGSSTGDGALIMSDATGSMFVQCIGLLPPSIMGAIISARQFFVVVESTLASASKEPTLVFDPCTVQIVVDGPCVQMDEGKGGKTCRSINRSCHGSSFKPASLFSRRLTGHRLTESIRPIAANDDETFIVDTPLVCIFVQNLRGGRGKFTVFGRLIALVESRNDNEWQALDHNRKGFWQCSITFSGESALQLCPALQEHRLFALSCTELYGLQDPVQYLRRKAATQVREQGTLELSTQLQDTIPWVEDLGHGYYMRFKGDKNQRQAGKANKATQHADNSLMSTEGEQYMYVNQAIEQFSNESVNGIEQSLWKAYHWKKASELREDQDMSIRGIISTYADVVEETTSELGGSSSVSKLTIYDDELEVFKVTVNFYEDHAKPRGLAQGMEVIVHNIVRVPLQGTGRFVFVGNSDTVTRVVSAANVVARRGSCSNCIRPKRSLSVSSEVLPHKHLWDFSQRREMETEESCEAGIIRFQVLRVEWLDISLFVDSVDCEHCAVYGEHGEYWNVKMSVKVIVDDGSAEGQMVCDGFDRSAKLLRASETECTALKNVAYKNKSLTIGEDLARTGLNSIATGKTCGQYDESLLTVYRMICKKRSGTSAAVVLNQTSTSPEGSKPYCDVDEVILKCFWLGFGRKLWTACSPHCGVTVECLAVFNECNCRAELRCNCPSREVHQPLETLRYLMGVEQQWAD